MARRPEWVRPIDTAAGKRYEVRVHLARDDGSRFQKRRRFKTVDEAVKWRNTVTGEHASGTLEAPSEVTLQVAADAYLNALHVRPTTLAGYVTQLRPAVTVLGDKPIQSIRREDYEKLIRDLAAGGVSSGDWRKPLRMKALVKTETGPWKATSIRPVLARLRAVHQRLVDDGTLRRNVAALVKPPPVERFEHRTLTPDQVRRLYKTLETDRLEHLHHLALHGLRRGELCGLQWNDVDLTTKVPTLTIRNQRLNTDAGVIESATTKTVSSERTLPIPSTLLPVLRRARKRWREERIAAGTDWANTDYVIVNELGAPYYPTSLNEFWQRALKNASLPRVRLHDARHTCGTLMHLDGVPIAVIAAWLGHSDAAFTQRTYAHSQDDALRLAAEAYGAAVTSPKRQSRTKKG